MARITGPLHSLTASGSLAKTINFRTRANRTIAARHSKPGGPPSTAQLAHRQLFANLAAAWKFATESWIITTGTVEQSWATLAEKESITPYNAYLKFNFSQIAEGNPPCLTYPPHSSAIVTWLDQPEINDPTGEYVYVGQKDSHDLYISSTQTFTYIYWDINTENYYLARWLTPETLLLWKAQTGPAGTYDPFYGTENQLSVAIAQ
jgi:hypothetical protein